MDYLTVGKRAEARVRLGPDPLAPGDEPPERRSGDTGFADWVAQVVGLPLGRFEREGGPAGGAGAVAPGHACGSFPTSGMPRCWSVGVCKRGTDLDGPGAAGRHGALGPDTRVVKMLALAKIGFDGDIVQVSLQPSPGSGRSGRMDGP